MEQLVDIVSCGDKDEAAMDQYFIAILRWALPIKCIVENITEHGFQLITNDDKLQLWHALTSELQDAGNALASFYIPVLDKALKMAKLK